MSGLVDLTATEMAARVRRREVSATELVEAHAEQIGALDQELGAFAVLDLERALRSAQEADRELLGGGAVGPLHGVPFSVKEQFAAAGLPYCEASRLKAVQVPRRDGVVVARMRAAGAILLGTTNMSELAMFPDTVNLVYGATRNPYAHDRSAGGSSGGEGAAVAAHLSPLGIGSDYAGSIRCPAHFCGVFGARPGQAALSAPGRGGAPDALGRDRLSTVGPLARSVEDVGLALEVLGGQPMAPARVGSVGVVSSHLDAAISPDCAAAVRFAAAALGSRGIPVEEVEPVGRTEAERIFDELTVTETRRILDALLPERIDDASPQLVASWERLDPGSVVVDSLTSLVRLEELAQEFDEWMNGDRLLLAPVATTPAFELGALSGLFDRFDACKLASALGLPAAAVPVSINSEGLPVAVQLIAARGRESVLLRGMAELAAASGDSFTPRSFTAPAPPASRD